MTKKHKLIIKKQFVILLSKIFTGSPLVSTF